MDIIEMKGDRRKKRKIMDMVEMKGSQDQKIKIMDTFEMRGNQEKNRKTTATSMMKESPKERKHPTTTTITTIITSIGRNTTHQSMNSCRWTHRLAQTKRETLAARS